MEHHQHGKATKKKKVVRMKILSMGHLGSGKTCIIKRFCENRFVSKYIPTVGVDYGVKRLQLPIQKSNVQQKLPLDVRVNFWDLSGDPNFLEVRNEFYKDCQGAFLVYDVTDKQSFTCLDEWLAEMRNHGCPLLDVSIALCANKTDRFHCRQVSEKEGIAFASANGMTYFEISAHDGSNIEEMFDFLFLSLVPTH